MNWRIKYILILLFIASCKINDEKDHVASTTSNYLIEVEELQKIIKAPTIKIIDFRKPELYNQEHIENAINIWRTDIEDQEFPYGGMMANQFQLETLFSKLGINNSDTLVIYDDNGLCDSARLWWVLQNYNFNRVLLLHGGISEWKKLKGTTTTEKTKITPSIFKFRGKPSMKFLIRKEDVLKSNKRHYIIDTRTADEYSGKRQKKGAFKGGRISNSIWMDWTNAITYHGDKKLKSIPKLDSIYSSIIPSKDDAIIVYCHSGVRSAHTTFVLTQLLGYQNVKNYDGSWSEWSYFNDLPFEKDSITLIKK